MIFLGYVSRYDIEGSQAVLRMITPSGETWEDVDVRFNPAELPEPEKWVGKVVKVGSGIYHYSSCQGARSLRATGEWIKEATIDELLPPEGNKVPPRWVRELKR